MNETVEHFYKLRILKTWVAQDPSLVFQCHPTGPRDGIEMPKKTHLLIDLRQNSFGLRVQAEKPADADANHAFIQILRKQIPSFSIKGIYQHKSSGDFWVPLLSGPDNGQPWLLRLAASKPPLASLIAPDKTIFVSFGQKGTFTKKHPTDAAPDYNDMIDILPSIMLEGLGNRDEEDHATDEVTLSEAPDTAVAISQLQKDLSARLKRKLKTGKKTLEKTLKDIPSPEDVSLKEREAQLLQNYSWMVKGEAFELRLDEALSGLPGGIVIPLEPDASLGQNMERKFAAFHKARRGRDLGQKQLQLAQQHIASLEQDIATLQKEQKSNVELMQLVRKYRLPEIQAPRETQQGEANAKPYKAYKSSTGHTILVGKAAIDNDILTKSAKSNDYWFHAVGVTGSHVIVPVTADIRQALPTALIRDAAILALHFSRIRDDYAGECYVTRKAHLKKQRGMPAGLWRIDQSETLFFRYSEEELKTLLQTVQV